MGLLDQLAGQLLGGAAGGAGQPGQQSPLVAAAFQLLESQGGLQGLVQKLSQGGLASQVASWVGTGANHAVTAEQIGGALGSDQLKEIAAKAGIPVDQAAGGLAQVLPQLIDHLTPQGQVPSGSLLDEGLALLKGKLGV